MSNLIDVAANVRLDLHGISKERVMEELDKAFERLSTQLQEQFPPTDKAPNHEERLRLFSHVFDQCEDVVLQTMTQLGMPKKPAQAHVYALRLAVQTVVVVTGEMTKSY